MAFKKARRRTEKIFEFEQTKRDKRGKMNSSNTWKGRRNRPWNIFPWDEDEFRVFSSIHSLSNLVCSNSKILSVRLRALLKVLPDLRANTLRGKYVSVQKYSKEYLTVYVQCTQIRCSELKYRERMCVY